MLIQINRVVYAANVNGIQKAGGELTTRGIKKANLTGTVPAMSEYISGYKKIQAMLTNYKALLTQDTRKLLNMEKSISEAEAKLIR